jgi:tRNA(Ile)-lysidine synthase
MDRYGMAPAGCRIGVAVSGGADSVCLLEVLRELAPGQLTVLHLDHQLRGEESRADAGFVAALAERFGLPIASRCAELGSGNLEEEARLARLEFFREIMLTGLVDRVATGHTRSDQAETVLFRLLRGAADSGLAGIRPVTTDGLIRPLLEVERREVEAFLRERGIAWREDSTNADPRFARNRIRHELLPQIEREWNPAIVETLARTAEWAGAETEYWREELDRLENELLVREGDAVLLNAVAIRELPPAVARRLIRRAIERTKGDLRSVDFRHTEEILRLAEAGKGSGRIQAPGIEIWRSLDWLRFVNYADGAPVSNYRVPAAVPGFTPIPGGEQAISLELIEKSTNSGASEYVYNGEMGCVDWDRVAGSLELRNWMPGDRYQPAQSVSARKIKTLFQLARIPKWERRRWPVLVDGGAIVWTRQFGAAAEYAAGPETRTILRVRETSAE